MSHVCGLSDSGWGIIRDFESKEIVSFQVELKWWLHAETTPTFNAITMYSAVIYRIELSTTLCLRRANSEDAVAPVWFLTENSEVPLRKALTESNVPWKKIDQRFCILTSCYLHWPLHLQTGRSVRLRSHSLLYLTMHAIFQHHVQAVRCFIQLKVESHFPFSL